MAYPMSLWIEVVEIKGVCPVYRVGDSMVIRQGNILEPVGNGAVCMHSLASIFPYYVALSHGVKAEGLGLAKKGGTSEDAYVQCLDPCDITGGGTVVFAIRKMAG
jgi:uncharacterized repeat protein (TIGR04076 family)